MNLVQCPSVPFNCDGFLVSGQAHAYAAAGGGGGIPEERGHHFQEASAWRT